jgi:phospholipase/carboxylesterase
MVDLLERIEIETRPAPTAAVIWLHGLGADGHDFEPIVPELGLPPGLGVRFVFPHAPMRPVTINNGYVMRAWYDIRLDGGTRREDVEGVRASQRGIEALIARERERGIEARRIVLAGFSQGGAMTYQVGLRHPDRLAGLLALSCGLPLADTVAAEASAANRDAPIFAAHGTHDDVVPLARGRAARDLLVPLGYKVEWHEYPMPHSVSPQEIADISHWLRTALTATS